MIRQLIHRYGSELLYHLGAPVYDRVETMLFGEAWQEWRLATIELLPRSAGTILDLGAGTGAMARACLRKRLDAAIIAVEPSRPMIGARITRPFGEQVVRAEASHLPLPDDCVDAVIIGFPGPYIRDATTWNELSRVLRPQGVVFALVGGRLDPTLSRSRLGTIVGWVVYGRDRSKGNQPALPPLPPLVRHPDFVGRWQMLDTERGTCYVWVARPRPPS